jgi:amidase
MAQSAIGYELDYCTARDVVTALVERRISALELVDYSIARIERLDRDLNAVVVRDFERAREAAKSADIALTHGERRPLLGVPITVKESFNVAGLPTTWGDRRFRDFVAQQDALIVERAKNAGAIILGKTNVPLHLADMQSFNEIYGTTNNPWDLSRTPGGSSGGSAAALAAGFGSLSLGSDLGGSMRIPAHFCGVFAHKPSAGIVPSRGHTPPASPSLPRESDLAVMGPMSRSATDLALAMEVIAGPDETGVGIGFRLALRPARHDNLRDFRVLVIDAHPLVPTGEAVRTAIARMSERLAKAGTKVARSSPLLPDLANTARLFVSLWSALRGAISPPNVYNEMKSMAAKLSPNDNSLRAERIRAMMITYREWFAADTMRAQFQQQWRNLFREWDILMCPVIATPAFRHDPWLPLEAREIEIDGKRYPYRDTQLVWSAIPTTCGLPATVMPIDRSDMGQPIGMQIVGPYLEDRTTITFAELLEREFGGFTAPPGYVG